MKKRIVTILFGNVGNLKMDRMTKLVAHGGGGIFSIYMDIIIQNILQSDDNDYCIKVKNNQYKTSEDCFDYALDQKQCEDMIVQDCFFNGGFRSKGFDFGAIEDSELLPIIKDKLTKFKIKKNITDYVDSFKLNNALGVHIRIKDMNRRHSEFGVFTFEDYLKKVNTLEKQVDDIFVASDNHESIFKLKQIFGDRIKYINAIRGVDEEDNTYKIQLENANNPEFWQEAFKDMLLLSKCKHLICRVSNFTNASIAYSDNIKVHRL